MADVGVIIPAGGQGARMGTRVPKQYLLLGGVPILQRTIDAFESRRDIREIVVAVAPRDKARARRIVSAAGFRKVRCVEGGAERQMSVQAALESLSGDVEIVLVHDAVRPLVGQGVITRVIASARKHRAAVVGTRVRDTVKLEGRKGFFTSTVPRDGLWLVQTPQGFRLDLLKRAHRAALMDGFVGTDEGSLVERIGVHPAIVEGDTENVKITTRFDLKTASLLLVKGRKRT